MREVRFIVDSIIKPALKGHQPALLIIKRNWDSIITDRYRSSCEAEKVSFKRGEKNYGVLYIVSFNGVASFYIENNRMFVIDKINTIFGYSLIQEIKIRQEPREVQIQDLTQSFKTPTILDANTRKIIDIKLKSVSDAELKRALEELGKTMSFQDVNE